MHAISLLEPPAYKADFKHFDWVNPNAPKGGTVRLWSEGSFDNLNPFTLQGVGAAGLALIYDSLMTSTPNELNVVYGQIAEWASIPDDYSSVTFGLRKEAKFHDGRPVTPEDVIFSMEAQKKANMQIGLAYKDVVRGEKVGPNEVKFHFSVTGNKKLPQAVATLTVVPKHDWENRDMSKTTLDIPLGSAAYKIKEIDRGRSITFERVANWWGKDLPLNKGQWNFDEIRFEYFRDRNVAFEQFKSGGIDYWYENSAKSWATEFEFPAIKRGLVKTDRVEQHRPTPMQAFAINMRRPQFEDRRVRKALNLAFNFEEMNEQLLYSAYTRTSSYFDNSKMTPKGLPAGDELKLLEEAKKIAPEGVPPEVFTEEFKQPTGGASLQHRKNLAEADRLLREAGYTVTGTQRRNAKGQPLKIEVLLNSPTFERHTQNYGADLRKLGIELSVRVVDPAQYQQRLLKFDYDMILHVIPQPAYPGNEQRLYWSSEGADRDGSRNVMGVKNKAVDFLVEKIVFAKGPEDLVPATKALDRVLMANHYVVAQWHYRYDRMAYWDKFGRPAKLPSIMPGFSFEQIWWFDPVKAQELAVKRANP